MVLFCIYFIWGLVTKIKPSLCKNWFGTSFDKKIKFGVYNIYFLNVYSFLMFIIIIISLKTNFRLMHFTFLAILMSCYIVYITDVVFSKTHGICASKVISKIMGQQSPITSIEVPHALESGCRIYANAWHYDGNDPCPLVISLHWTESSRGWWDSRHAYILAEDNPEQTTFPSHLSW